MVCTFTPECATESPGGLIKCKLLIPIPEFMIQWVWAGTQVLAFLEFPGIIDAIGYFENPWSKTIIKLNLHICIELLKYSRYFYFLLLVILTSLQRWRGFWWCHWVKWGSGKVSQLPQVDRVSDRPQVCLQSLPVPCLSPAEDKSWQPILGLQVEWGSATRRGRIWARIQAHYASLAYREEPGTQAKLPKINCMAKSKGPSPFLVLSLSNTV